MQTVVETTPYLRRAEKLLNAAGRAAVVDFLASDPTAGAIIRNTGGVRKVRIPLEGRGKSGGARVIYYFHDENMPLFLFAVYAKNEKSNLTDAECAALRKVVQTITKGA